MKRLIAGLALAALTWTAIAGCIPTPSGNNPSGEKTLLIFHNGSGPMCLEALAWLATMQSEHLDLIVQEYLTTDPAGLAFLNQLKAQYGQSQGVSTSFGYLPVIFFGGQAFSGFNDDVRQGLTGLIAAG